MSIHTFVCYAKIVKNNQKGAHKTSEKKSFSHLSTSKNQRDVEHSTPRLLGFIPSLHA